MSRFQALSLQHGLLVVNGGESVGEGALWWHVAARYGLAVACVALGLSSAIVFEYFTAPQSFGLYVAVVASAWLGGAGPGCMSVVLATLGREYFLTPPIYSLRVDPEEVPGFVVFIVCAAISLAVSARLRRAERAMRQAHDTLETTVERRTAELRETNAALMVEIAERERADMERERSAAALRDAQAQLARVSRLATVAECAAVAHEVNQPLTAIVTNAGACLRSLAQDPPALCDARQAADAIIDDGLRASAVIARIGSLLRDRKPKLAPVDLNAAIHEVLALTRGTLAKENIVVRKQLAKSLPTVSGDAVQLQQVLLNLVNNAVEAMAGETMAGVNERPRVLTIRSSHDDDGFARVEIEDSGIGLGGVDLERMFESFYTTKADGLGMGLSISHSIIVAHSGRLSVSPVLPHGARFQFTVPFTGRA
jgi:C4-dicarboxylate-specific signal transduction histidine kinase